jgi:hypothetical protein
VAGTESKDDPASMSSRPTSFEERYRLYIDESGDHVFKHLDKDSHRYLCLLGCWFRNPEYLAFHKRLEDFKRVHIPHHPDDPLILHREEIINRRSHFGRLCDPSKAEAFDSDLLEIIAEADFRIVAVVIDKKGMLARYGDTAAHPYHLAMGFMLQRYCGYLNHINRCGDVMAESRGGVENRLLKDSYERVYKQGAWMQRAPVFQRALTSREIKIKPKSANIAGLQLADLLGHPVRHAVLLDAGQVNTASAPFACKLLRVIDGKFNRHLYTGRVSGYGKILFPK